MKLDWTERVALAVLTPLAALFLLLNVLTTLRLVHTAVDVLEVCCEILYRLLE